MLENFSHQDTDITPKSLHEKQWVWYVKAGSLSVITLVMAFFTGSFLQKMFMQYPIPYDSLWVPLIISVLVFLIFLFLATLSIQKKWFLAIIALLSGVIITLCILSSDTVPTLIVGGVLTILLITAVLFGRREVESSLKIRFVRVLHAVVARSMLGIALMASFLVYTASLAHPLDDTNILFPKSVFTSMTPAVSQLIKPVFGDIDLSLTVSEMAGKGVDSMVENSVDRTLKRSITPQIRDLFIQKYIEQIQTTFKNSLGVSITPNEKLSDALYTGLLKKFNSLPDATKRGVALFFSVVFLLGVQAAAWVARIVMIPIAFLLYEIGLTTKFFKTSFKAADKELITLQ
ncbi:MAG: hypothetical protein M1320_02515 [Patescibacteria group bacterium]|nr:hypothetical protein [Patescibacteria group bacterium]